ncbi:MAG: mercuric reductase [Acidobacteria bacterium]|jgi:pyruvate/2-oxoglutarate dehydrogenase complex dihydrolipoamide dehydrogenase (E3) component|nr:mercuric reductase [Acidobacteriota bacterium]
MPPDNGESSQAGAPVERLKLTPDDEQNRRLIDNVRPPGWVNPRPDGRYNLVVIGGGTAGLVAAAGAAGLGAKVALIERHLMGGDCLNVGCVPSKAVIRSARVAAEKREDERFGIRPGGPVEVDFPAVMQRMRGIRAAISPNDSARRFATHYGVDVYFGQARFTGRATVEVKGTELQFARAVIASGARPAVPEVPGLAGAGFLTNESVFNLTVLPPRLAVIGGGPIGCELAQAFARLGSEVTIVERGEQFLAREDRDAASVLRAAMERDGVRVRLATVLERVEIDDDAKVLHLKGEPGIDTFTADKILVGTGRAPNVEGLGLEAAGVRYGPDGVQVDDYLRTSNPRVFAAGDVCLPYRFTHTADAAARVVVQNAFFRLAGRRRVSRLTIPWCTYTDPEVAHVGLNERMAERRGVAIDTYTVPLSEVDRAVAEGEEGGFLKVHTRKGGDRILGATLVSRHAGETISELTLAMVAGVRLGRLAGVIHPYPTQAEAIRKVADAYNRTRLTPRTACLLKAYFALIR